MSKRRTIKPGQTLQVGRWRITFPEMRTEQTIEVSSIDGKQAWFDPRGNVVYLVTEEEGRPRKA